MRVAVVLFMHSLSERSIAGTIPLDALWDELASGRLSITSVRCERGRCFARLEARDPSLWGKHRAIDLLERVLCGEGQKVLAYERGVSGATIASHCASALSSMAPGQSVSRAPILLVAAAHAARGVDVPPARFEPSEEPLGMLVSYEVPGACFEDRLSPCELAVARLLIEGKRHVEIAELRNTSVRTTANQLASIFTKLGLSGRGYLRAQAILETARLARPVPIGPAPEPQRAPMRRAFPSSSQLVSLAV